MSRFYTPSPAGGGQWNDHYAVRSGDNRILCADMRLCWDQADRLCDVLETERQRALNLDPPAKQDIAA